jgi:hypothetical protein
MAIVGKNIPYGTTNQNIVINEGKLYPIDKNEHITGLVRNSM